MNGGLGSTFILVLGTKNIVQYYLSVLLIVNAALPVVCLVLAIIGSPSS